MMFLAGMLAWGSSQSLGESGGLADSESVDMPPTSLELGELWQGYLQNFGEVVCKVESEFFDGPTLGMLKQDHSNIQIVTSRSVAEGYVTETAFVSPRTKLVTSTDVRVVNRRYAFSLTKKEKDSVELWELDADSPSEDLLTTSEGAKLARSWVEGAFATTVPNLTLLQVFRHESFRLKDVSETAEGNWRIGFDCEVPGELGRVFYGPVALVVQREGYRLPISLAARVRTPLCDSEVFINMEYADALGLPRLSRFRSANENLCDKERSAADMILYITWRRPTEEDRKTLYLSYYGLPEPTKPSRINWWIMLGGALLLAGAYRLISRRDQWART